MNGTRRLLFGGRILGLEVHRAEPPGWVYAVLCWAAMLDVVLGLTAASGGDLLAWAIVPAGLFSVIVLGCAWTSED
jgi:hypothetical protein